MKASAEEVPGIGLGLNLAKTLIEGMKGKIEVESRLGEGSKFIVRLPVWTEDSGIKETESSRNEIKILPENSSRSSIKQQKYG